MNQSHVAHAIECLRIAARKHSETIFAFPFFAAIANGVIPAAFFLRASGNGKSAATPDALLHIAARIKGVSPLEKTASCVTRRKIFSRSLLGDPSTDDA